jgi:hypothetical protein
VVAGALVVALAVGFAAGWVAHTPKEGSVTVSGRLLMVGGPANASLPVPGDVTARNGTGHETTAVADSHGRFSFALSPGTYTITARTSHYDGGGTPCFAREPVTVSDIGTIIVDVLCQMK